MEIKLQDKRVYISSDDLYGLSRSLANKHKNLYMITPRIGTQQQPSETKFKNLEMVYSD